MARDQGDETPSDEQTALPDVDDLDLDDIDLDDLAELADLDGHDELEDGFDDDAPGLQELLGLPDALPPMRLPPENVLADEARQIPMLAKVKALAEWVGERRPVDELGLLGTDDTVAAATALGLTVPPTPVPMTLMPELVRLWELAEMLGFVDIDEEEATPGDLLADWPDGDDDTVLDLWQQALTLVLARSLPLEAELAGEEELDFRGAGAGFMGLFLARDEGVPLSELSELIQDTAVADLDADDADHAWQRWVTSVGEPAGFLYGLLTELGAVTVEDDVVRQTPLGASAVRTELLLEGVDIPLLPPRDEMTAADLVAFATGSTDDEFAVEVEAWRAQRSDEAAAGELLAVAAEGGPSERMVGTALASAIGPAAEPALRKALDLPTLRPYAKTLLTELSGAHPDLAPTQSEMAWLMADQLAGSSSEFDEDELPDHVAEVVPPGSVAVFEEMWRLEHPHAHEALTVIGTYHPDKQTAKAARAAAFKISG